jgi:hypothetical protein
MGSPDLAHKIQKIENRIVSLAQPHIRPIVRGKAGKPVEFGAKLSASCFEGYVFLDRISWDNFNEAGDLKAQVEAFKNFTGYYPESVHVDKIYRNRDHRAWCKERGIRISGLPLGRPFLCLFYRRIARTHLDINSSYAQANDRKQKLNFLPGVNRLSSRLGVFPIYSASPI